MKTCAKINLFLKVLGTRADGYHELETVFLPIPGLYDDVTVMASENQGLSISCNDHELETEKNLCLKAARAFCNQTGLPQAFHVDYLQKPLSHGELVKLAATVGADVPFFLKPAPSAATGIGDVLSPIDVSANLDVLVISPGIPIPVKWAYDHCKPQPAVTLDKFRQTCASASVETIAKLCHNDLEYAIFDKFPVIAMMRDHLLAQGALCVHVSGSGSSLFAILPPNRHDIRDDFANAFQDVASMTMHP